MFKKTLMSIFILFSGLSLFSTIENNNIKFKSDNYETEASLKDATGEIKLSDEELAAGFESYLSEQTIATFGSKVPINYYSFKSEVFGIEPLKVNYVTFIKDNLVNYYGKNNIDFLVSDIKLIYGTSISGSDLINNENTYFSFQINTDEDDTTYEIKSLDINAFVSSSEFIDLDKIDEEILLALSNEIKINIGVFTSTISEEDKITKVFNDIESEIKTIILNTINEFVQSNLLISLVGDDQQDFSMITDISSIYATSVNWKFRGIEEDIINSKTLSEITFINVELKISHDETIFVGQFPTIESLDFWYQAPISNFKWWWIAGSIAIIEIIAIMIILIILAFKILKQKRAY